MQGQTSTVRSYSATYEFDQGSTSNTQVMDQHNLLLNPSGGQNTPSHLLSPCDAHIFCKNMINQETGRLSTWKSGGSWSTERPEVEGSYDEAKREHAWTSSLAINIEDGPGSKGRPSEVLGGSSLDNINLDLNINQVDSDQPYEHFKESVDVSRQDSSTFWTSSKGIDLLPEVGGRQVGEIYNDHSSCKRKNVEIIPGQSSGGGSSSALHESENGWLSSVPALHNAHNNLERSTSTNYTGLHLTVEQLNHRIDSDMRPVPSDTSNNHSFGNVSRSAEYFHRNTRMRINPTLENVLDLPNLWSQENSSQLSAQQQYSPIIPVHQLEDSRLLASGVTSHSYSPVQVYPGLPQNLNPFTSNGTSDARIGAQGIYSNSTNIGGEISTLEDLDSTSMPRNNISEHLMFGPLTNTNQLLEDSTSWQLTSGNRSVPGRPFPASQVGTSAGTRQPLRSRWVSHRGPSQNHQSLQEILHRSLFPYAGSQSTNQSVPLQQHSYSSASRIIGNEHSGAGFDGYQQSYLSSVPMMDTQNDGFSGVPLSTQTLPIARNRSRRMSEMRDVLDRIRRGRIIRYEDASIFGGGNLHDRHRDMRLDVDNMSYEELLALEERIGYVSTGLSEETIMKILKQRKYASIALEPLVEVEPCCICREDYVEEEELGILDCGHDFHTSCIKQWLMLKNLCPICKRNALST